MFLENRPEHALITIYGDTSSQDISRAVTLYLPERDIRILSPTDEETLVQASQNSVVIFVGISGADDPNLRIARKLQDHRLVVADIIAFCTDSHDLTAMQVMGHGFDGCITLEDTSLVEFKKYIAAKINKGARRLSGLIQEEEFRRLNDALSIAPISMIIFDADKRAVFVSDHYYRAYPKSAPRLIRGLRVYDAFEMMVREEGLEPNDERYEQIKQFWYNLDGKIEFTLDNGVSYRLKAIQLPSNRGTVIIGQNITEYMRGNKGKK